MPVRESSTRTVGFSKIGAIKLANANAARAEAELEIGPARGLVNTVVSLYFGMGAAAEKVAIAERALSEADKFLDIATRREAARESAHADVLKAQLEQQQRQREVADTHLEADKARLELAVLLYPDPNTPFTVEPATAPPTLPDRAGVETLARQNNPELRSAPGRPAGQPG